MQLSVFPLAVVAGTIAQAAAIAVPIISQAAAIAVPPAPTSATASYSIVPAPTGTSAVDASNQLVAAASSNDRQSPGYFNLRIYQHHGFRGYDERYHFAYNGWYKSFGDCITFADLSEKKLQHMPSTT